MQGLECAFQGSLGRDPELRTAASGKPWAKLAVAVTQEGKGDGESTTIWVQVVCFNEVAERVCKQATKGGRIYAEGVLKQTQWTDKTTGEKRSGLEVTAWRVAGARRRCHSGEQGGIEKDEAGDAAAIEQRQCSTPRLATAGSRCSG